jgi:hypothetical protein
MQLSEIKVTNKDKEKSKERKWVIRRDGRDGTKGSRR